MKAIVRSSQALHAALRHHQLQPLAKAEPFKETMTSLTGTPEGIIVLGLAVPLPANGGAPPAGARVAEHGEGECEVAGAVVARGRGAADAAALEGVRGGV